MSYFPFFMEMEGRPGLIVGGGVVACRKVEKLLPYGPRLTVVAPEIAPEIAAVNGLTLLRRPFRPEDLEGMVFVISAAPPVNRQVAELCHERHLPVNVVDDRELCSFLFPALVKRGSLSVGISTGGASPTAAIYLKEQIAALLPENFEELLAFLDSLRPALKAEIPEVIYCRKKKNDREKEQSKTNQRAVGLETGFYGVYTFVYKMFVFY